MAFTLSCRAEIEAPAALAWEALVDFSAYGSWNRFIPRIELEGPPEPGSRLMLYAKVGPLEIPNPERVKRWTPPGQDQERGWLTYHYDGRMARLGLMKAFRWNCITPRGPDRCLYESEETMEGLASCFLPRGAVQRGLHQMAEDLARRAEELAAAR